MSRDSHIANPTMGLEGIDCQRLSDEDLETLVLQASLPRHVAIIMDGNGRWAAQRGLSRIAGHREGVSSAREAVMTCRELGISALTLYAFSLENWKRPKEEIALLMDLICQFFQSECERFLQEKIRIRAIGRLDLLPSPIQSIIREMENASREYDRLTVTLALSYGGRAEIIDAVRKIVCEASQGTIGSNIIDEGLFQQYLATCDLPDPDLLIRTSGEARVSNFLLWQIAYTELYFTKSFWPEFRRRDLLLALLDFQKRERRLGGLTSAEGYSQQNTLSKSKETSWDDEERAALPSWPDSLKEEYEPVAICQSPSRDFASLSWLE